MYFDLSLLNQLGLDCSNIVKDIKMSLDLQNPIVTPANNATPQK